MLRSVVNHTMLCLLMMTAMTACHDIPEAKDSPSGNFEALWRIIDEHYCFLNEKNLDWDAVHEQYGARISPSMTREELFTVLAEMLAELRDGHTNLVTPWQTSYYRKWWSDYPANYDARLIEQYYFNFNYRQVGGMKYGVLRDNIGYIGYQSFSVPVGDGNLDAILAYLITCDGLVIDIRDNGGGYIDMVERIVARFIDKRILAGYMVHKNGPGRNDFSEPYPYYFDPAPQGRIMWMKPVVVLTNRSTFSAANNFVSVMQYLPQVTLVGDITGGGSGMPFSSELPCGWSVRFSACSVLDAQGNTTEFGIAPHDDNRVDLDPLKALDGTDTMLEHAINILAR